MTIEGILLSSIIGCLAGLFYGLSFLFARGRVFSYRNPEPKRKLIIAIITSSAARILLLAVLFFYLLRLPTINFILLMMAFFATFWGTVLKRKARSYDSNQSS